MAMKDEDLCCGNCEASRLIKIPCVGATSEADYMGFMVCRQKLSDHHRHLVAIRHSCAWHSEPLASDKRFVSVIED